MRYLLLTLLLASTLTACGSPQLSPQAKLEQQMDAFHAHLRWGRFRDAARFFEEGERAEFLGEMSGLGDDYEVTDFEIEAFEFIDSNHATVTVWIQSLQLPSTIVREDTYVEVWEYQDGPGMWVLTERSVLEEE